MTSTKRRPFPPCCVDVLRRINRAFSAEMCELGLGAPGSAGDYAAIFGLLLGIARHNDVIPWSNDGDVVVLETTMAAMVELWDAGRSGLSLIRDGIYRMCANENFLGGRLTRWEGDFCSVSLRMGDEPSHIICLWKNARPLSYRR